MTAPDRPGDLLAGRCDHTTADCTHDRPGDRDQQQAAEVLANAGYGHDRWVAAIAAALAATRAEEAARWRAKIEALADRLSAVRGQDVGTGALHVAARQIRAVLDGDR